MFCTHFGLMPDEQALAVQTSIAAVRREAGPVLLMGDLNLTPDAPALAPLFSARQDTANGMSAPLTFPACAPDRKIDYILHSSGLTLRALRTVSTLCSDHLPLIAEFTL